MATGGDLVVANVMVDTSGYASVIDACSAATLGFEVTPADAMNCTTYQSPGYPPQKYVGLVHDPIEVKIADAITLFLPSLKLVSGQHVLFILGADTLCGGHPLHLWNFAGIELPMLPCRAVKG